MVENHALVLAPGSAVHRFGLAGRADPSITVPSEEYGLYPAGEAATTILWLSAKAIYLQKAHLRSRSLVVVEPFVNFSKGTKAALTEAATILLGMQTTTFVSSHLAVPLSVFLDSHPHIIVDVGWASTRVVVRGYVVAVAAVGVKDVNESLKPWLPTDSLPHEIDAMRAAVCFFPDLDLYPEELVGQVVDDDGNTLVASEARFKCPEVLFDKSDGTLLPHSAFTSTGIVC